MLSGVYQKLVLYVFSNKTFPLFTNWREAEAPLPPNSILYPRWNKHSSNIKNRKLDSHNHCFLLYTLQYSTLYSLKLWLSCEILTVSRYKSFGGEGGRCKIYKNFHNIGVIITKCYCNFWRKAIDKFKKLSKIGFSVECFTADFLENFQRKVTAWLLGGCLGTPNQIQTFEMFSSNFLIS